MERILWEKAILEPLEVLIEKGKGKSKSTFQHIEKK